MPIPAGETPVSLYLHYPYCQAKCFYCDFNSHVEARPDARRYLAAMLREAQEWGITHPRTLYFGGGTPSLIPLPDLEWFLRRLEDTTGYRRSSREFTIEANPESLTSSFLDLCLSLGVDRISLGVQALDEPTLRFFGRVHTTDRALEAIDLLRRRGLPNWNVDLIMGAPSQSAARWQQGVEHIVACRPPHVSLYDLIYEPGTTLSSLRTRGKLEPRPDDEQARAYLWNQRTLRRHGYEPYEVSAFARPGRRCLHNLVYWTNGEYVGLGAGAASFRRGWRTKNVDDPRRYVELVERLGRASTFAERLSPQARLVETLMLKLRLRDPIDLRAEASVLGDVDIAWLRPTLSSLRSQGLVHPTVTEDVLVLTARGRRLADYVIEELCRTPRPVDRIPRLP